MNTGKRRTIRKKVAQLILAVSLATVLLLGLATGVGLVNIRQDTVDSLGELNSQTSEDATGTLREQLQEELVTLRRKPRRAGGYEPGADTQPNPAGGNGCAGYLLRAGAVPRRAVA